MANKPNIQSHRQKLIIYIVLVIATLAVFGQVYQYDFINFDDPVYITENGVIRNGVTPEGISWAFTTKHVGLWNPMVWLSFMLDSEFYSANAGGYHVTNLILHILSTLLLFWLFCRMTGDVWKSAFVGAIFALHPLHVESVAWVSERKDVLSAFFWMLTLCLYVYYREKPDIKRYLSALLCFILALMSKPMVVTLPLILILLDYWPLSFLRCNPDSIGFRSFENKAVLTDIAPVSKKQGKKKNKADKENGKENPSPFNRRVSPETKITEFRHDRFRFWDKVPFFILSAVLMIITVSDSGGAPSNNFPLGARLANAPVSFITYLVKTIWPYDLSVLYPFRVHIPVWQVAASVFLIIVISAAVIATAKRLPYLFTGWLWFAITILPVIGIIQISTAAPYAIADRYHYLPSIGIAVMLVWGLPSLFKSEDRRRKILYPAAITFLAVISILSCKQTSYWENSITLFNHALQVTTDNYVMHYNIALPLSKEGKIKEAIYHYEEAIRIKPDYDDAYYNKGNVYDKLGENQLAIEDFSKAISINPANLKAYNNRGNAYNRLGKYQLAVEDFNKAINRDPKYATAYNNRGNAYAALGRRELAIADFNEAIRLIPYYADAYYNRGTVYAELGQYQHAIEDLNEDIRLKPDDVYGYYARANVHLGQGIKEQGCDDARKACALGKCGILKFAQGKGYCL
ncbi:MAG TPA: tetratricopeptide repeat protein [Smithella sp.]|nr:tetratricopeptide repeat protein [Smithella sp.]